MFRTENDQPRDKKRFSLTKPVETNVQIDVLSKATPFPPKRDEELELLHAGLGKRLLSFPDTFKHSEVFANMNTSKCEVMTQVTLHER